MAYTTNQLISDSYYLSGILSRNLGDTVTGQQITVGLNLLNDIIGSKFAETQIIPYFTEYDFVATINQEKYFIANLVQIETFTFNLGVVRFATDQVQRKAYFGSGRTDNISSLPFSWHMERCLGGANLYLYYLPNDHYPLKIFGKFSLPDVALGQDLDLTIDQYYINYLRYKLAQYICHDSGVSFPPDKMAEMESIEESITYVSPPDLTMSKKSTLQTGGQMNWAHVNMSPGWNVPQ